MRAAEYSDEDLKPGGAAYAIVWGRDTSQANVEEYLKRVDADLLITGHVPCENGFLAPNDRRLILDSLGTPAAYCLFPADEPLTHADLVSRVRIL